jgi:hypothetical protein
MMTIGDLWLGNSGSKIKDDASVLEQVCNLSLVFRKKCNELLEIRYPLLNVTVPLQLLVTAILKVTKPLLVT